MEAKKWNVVTSAGENFPDVVKKDPEDALLVFDFDGTLSHMRPDPETVTMVEPAASALEKLAKSGVQIAIISGRPLDALLRLGKLEDRPAFANAVILGQYGVERLDVAGGERRDPPVPESIRGAYAELQEVVESLPGAHLEDKGRALAVHTRRMPDPEGALEKITDVVQQIADRHGLIVEPGRLVWELRSQTTDKGDAMRELLADVAPRSALMAGDDLGDLAAFQALKDFDENISTCVLVSASEEQPVLAEQADVLADGPDGVANWLEHLADSIAENDW